MVERISGFRAGNGVVCGLDTDDCTIELSRGAFTVFFEDGFTDPAEVGFETSAEAEAFVAKSDRAFRKGEQRPFRIDKTGVPAGAPLRFVKPSKVHATVEDAMSECIRKSTVLSELEKTVSPDQYAWTIDPKDRSVVITVATSVDKASLEADLKSASGTNLIKVV